MQLHFQNQIFTLRIKTQSITDRENPILMIAKTKKVQIGEKQFRFIVNEIKYDVNRVLTILDTNANWDTELAKQFAAIAIKCINPSEGYIEDATPYTISTSMLCGYNDQMRSLYNFYE
jgi:hypothetical protein